MMAPRIECPGGTKAANPYGVGTLLWIERNRYIDLRSALDDLIAGRITADEAAADLWAMETDTLGRFVPPGHSSALPEQLDLRDDD